MKSTTVMMLCVLLGMNFSVVAEDAPKPKPASRPEAKTEVKSAAAKTNTAHASDQLTLDPTLVTGNRELPKVMYIVPWKKADLSNLPGQPPNTLLDEALTPVDREVFRREVAYYEVVSDKDHARTPSASDAPPNGPTSGADKK